MLSQYLAFFRFLAETRLSRYESFAVASHNWALGEFGRLFCTTLWGLWLRRNKEVLEGACCLDALIMRRILRSHDEGCMFLADDGLVPEIVDALYFRF